MRHFALPALPYEHYCDIASRLKRQLAQLPARLQIVLNDSRAALPMPSYRLSIWR